MGVGTDARGSGGVMGERTSGRTVRPTLAGS